MTTTYEVAGWHLGVRSSDRDLDAVIRRTVAHPVVGDPPRSAPPNFSLWAPAASVTGPTMLPTLYLGCTPVLRSRSVPRLIRALAGQLEDYRRVTRADAVAFQALGVVNPSTDRAALLSRSVRHLQPSVPRLLERHGLCVVDGMVALIAPTGELVVDPPAVRGARPDDDAAVIAGRFHVRDWWSYVSMSRSEELVAAMALVRNQHLLGPSVTLEGLAATIRGARLSTMRSSKVGDAAAVARQVERSLRNTT